MVDNTEAEPTPGHAVTHRVSKADPGVMVEGVFELIRCTLSEVLNPDAIERALDKARKQPAVKAMLAQAKSKGSSAAAKAARGPSTIRSNYNLFTQECFHALKAANIQVGIIEVGSLWNVLPEEIKADFNKRYGGVRESYNAKITAGTPVVLSEEVAAYEAAQDLEPVDYVKLYHQYKGAAAAAAEAKASGTPAANGKTKPKAPVPVAAPAVAAAVPAADVKRPAEPATEEKHKHKKHRKAKKEGDDYAAAAAATPIVDGPSAMKHKHKKEKKQKKEKEPEESE